MSVVRHIPNVITCLNLLAGCMAVVCAAEGDLFCAAGWVVAAAAFDFLDGFAARCLHAFSPIGKDLDSLADLVSFGLAPAMSVYILLDGITETPLPYVAFLVPVFSALRLARFNNDSRQSDTFIGLPVPAHALFWVSLACSLSPLGVSYGERLLFTIPFALVATSLLLVSPLPMFSLKMKRFSFKGNERRYLLVAAALPFTLLWGYLGIAGSVFLYIALNLVKRPSP
ncbi:MAG: CDP-diacylglycerol--serine O-phosphatidyltransferase [Tannerellaceae bacterium]|nr:CDP-diacylglycerol--serine O-phosphatidyltransferase [Tannerellaceae bacterium]